MGQERTIEFPIPDGFDKAEDFRRIAQLVIALLMAGMPVETILRRLMKED